MPPGGAPPGGFPGQQPQQFGQPGQPGYTAQPGKQGKGFKYALIGCGCFAALVIAGFLAFLFLGGGLAYLGLSHSGSSSSSSSSGGGSGTCAKAIKCCKVAAHGVGSVEAACDNLKKAPTISCATALKSYQQAVKAEGKTCP